MSLYRNNGIHRPKQYWPRNQEFTNPAYQPTIPEKLDSIFRTSLVGKQVRYLTTSAGLALEWRTASHLTAGKHYTITSHKVGFNLVGITDDEGTEIFTSIAPRVSFYLGAVGKFELVAAILGYDATVLITDDIDTTKEGK